MALETNPLAEPDKAGMKATILETIKQIKTSLPQADIAPKGLQSLEALFTVANNSSQRRETEALFLADVCPALHAPIKPKLRIKVTQFHKVGDDSRRNTGQRQPNWAKAAYQ